MIIKGKPIRETPVKAYLVYTTLRIVISLWVSTVASGMFQMDFFGLQHPSTEPRPTGKTLLVWGGASSLGCMAIQLSIAAGVEVIATASPQNFDLLKRLGASHVFDYRSKSIDDELISAFKGKESAGCVDCIGENGAMESCLEVMRRSKGNKFVAAAHPLPEDLNVDTPIKFIWGSLFRHNEVGKAVLHDYLPKAMVEGKFVPAPDSHIVGHGLESVQAGIDARREGLSAKKLVVTL